MAELNEGLKRLKLSQPVELSQEDMNELTENGRLTTSGLPGGKDSSSSSSSSSSSFSLAVRPPCSQPCNRLYRNSSSHSESSSNSSSDTNPKCGAPKCGARVLAVTHRNLTVTYLLHYRYITVTLPLYTCYITVIYLLHYRYRQGRTSGRKASSRSFFRNSGNTPDGSSPSASAGM